MGLPTFQSVVVLVPKRYSLICSGSVSAFHILSGEAFNKTGTTAICVSISARLRNEKLKIKNGNRKIRQPAFANASSGQVLVIPITPKASSLLRRTSISLLLSSGFQRSTVSAEFDEEDLQTAVFRHQV